MPYEIKELTGSLFENADKRSDKSPDFTGNCKIDGKEYRLAGWWTEARSSGTEYISLKISDPEEYKRQQQNDSSRSSSRPQPPSRRAMAPADFERERAKRQENIKPQHFGADFADDDIPF